MLVAGQASSARAEQTNAVMPELTVIASPLPMQSADADVSVVSLPVAAMKAAGSESVPAALEYLGMVHVSERGNPMVQADVSIRGSSFQQVLVTLEGAPLTDPQTAHHNMDLPFPRDALAGVTVIPGPGSAVFGPTALAGTIDMSLRAPQTDGGLVSVAAGGFDTFRLTAREDVVAGPSATTLAAASATSDGFMDGTDYEILNLWGSSVVSLGGMRLRVSAGRTEKDFGAADFYGDFPSREQTGSTLIDLAPELIVGGWTLRILARYREHDDDFVLLADDPDFYHNEHASETYTERVVASGPPTRAGATAIGVERSDASLDSSNIGQRDSATTSAFAQHRVGDDRRWMLDAGIRLDNHSRWGAEISPSLGTWFRPLPGIRLRGRVARGIRPPSFTELYYTDPKNTGNPDLEPESGWGGEVGADAAFGPVHAALTFFRSDADDAIDWVRNASSDPWEASNIGKLTVSGSELAIGCKRGRASFEANYRNINLDHEAGAVESKYVLNAPKHDVGLLTSIETDGGFSVSAQARYREVPDLDNYWLVGARIAQKLGRVTVFASGQNLLDEEYVEIPGVPTAERYVEGGVEVNW
jgi:iron complex outermembrane receptor protein